jgi:hypothetical protein
MTTATLKATPVPAGDPATGIRIRRALQQPGAKGKKGFLLWATAALPKAMADKVINAAAQHVKAGMVSAANMAARGPAAGSPVKTAGTMGGFRGFGYVGDPTLMTIGVDTPTVSDSATAAVINATDSSAADPSWLSSVSSALQLAGQAYLTKTQVDSANQIFQTNLSLAQRGLPLIPTNPTAYGLPAPTVNFGLSNTTLTPVLWIAGGLGALFLISSLSRGRKRA